MIGKNVQNFCSEDISLIENYKLAISDKTQTWDCHHRLETDLGLSADELKVQNRYFNVPASELIFMTKAEHQKLHNTGKNLTEETKKKLHKKLKGEKSPLYGKHPSEETKKKLSENCNFKGTHPTWMNNGITRVRPTNQEDIEHYRGLGYSIGYKLKQLI